MVARNWSQKLVTVHVGMALGQLSRAHASALDLWAASALGVWADSALDVWATSALDLWAASAVDLWATSAIASMSALDL